MSWAGVQPNAGSYGYSGLTGGVTYSYSATQNNGQITQASDTLSGETISYQYDLLKRLTSASSAPISGSTPAAWTQTYQYDGFGNLTAKVLNGTSTPIAVNAATNQLSSAYYDANGNMTSGAGATFTYDYANRIASAAETSGGIEYYGYAPDNKRVYRLKSHGVTENYTFYGAFGERLGVFSLYWYMDAYGYYSVSGVNPLQSSLWFAGKLIYEGVPSAGFSSVNAVYQDRPGTNRASGARFRPFGEEITSTTNDRTKFGTYTRDSYTGLDYADQRYYASTYGRFNTADRLMSSAQPSTPLTWNRYGYVEGDPINRRDPTGLCSEEDWWTGCDCNDDPDDPFCSSDPNCPSGGNNLLGGNPYCDQQGGGVGGGSGAAPPSPPPPTCDQTETAFIQAYLVGEGSPLASYAGTIVQDADAAGIDDRFIVALAGQESSYGANITRGPYNAWNNLAHTANKSPYGSWTAAINGVTNLLTGKLYFGSGKKTVSSIYGTYDNSNLKENPKYPTELSDLTKIYKQLVGPTASGNSAVNFARCPPQAQ